MRKPFLLIVAALFILPIGGRAAHAQEAPTDDARMPSVELPAELDRVLRDYEEAWSGGEEEALADLFAEDGMIRNPRGWTLGREAIRAQYENAGGSLQLRAVSYSADGTSGYIVGAYGYGADPNPPDRGVFVLALTRANESAPWLIAADLDHGINRE